MPIPQFRQCKQSCVRAPAFCPVPVPHVSYSRHNLQSARPASVCAMSCEIYSSLPEHINADPSPQEQFNVSKFSNCMSVEKVTILHSDEDGFFLCTRFVIAATSLVFRASLFTPSVSRSIPSQFAPEMCVACSTTGSLACALHLVAISKMRLCSM